MEVLKSLTVSDAGENPRSQLSHRSSKLDPSEVKHSSNKETFTIEDLNKPFGKDIPNPFNLIERNIPKGRRELLRSEWVKNMASLRFQTWGLKGYWRVDDDKVEMFGRSSEETEQCMHLLKETVLERTLKLRKGSEFIVESDKWQLITGNLKKKYPDQVQFEVKHEDREVVIYSTCTIILKDSCDAIRIFLRDNEMKMIKLCYDEPVITFITKNKSKLKKIRNCLSQYCLEISLVDNTKLLLKGIGYGVGQALKMVHALASKYDAKLTEENRFDSDNEEEDDVERFSDEEKADSDIAVQMYLDVGSTDAVLRALCFPGDDRLIYVVASDITDLPVEALVNAADKTLKHNGGLAKALVEKGGRSIQEECTFHVQRSGNVQVGQVYCSDAGTMSCSVIIHAVGPKWTDGKSNEEEKLFECITNCLKSASRLKLGSVAFPAISAGSYKFPIRDATLVIVKAVKEFLLQEPRCSIRDIYLCDKALSTADVFTMALKDSFDNEDIVVSDAKQITKTSEHVKSESERYDVRQLLFI
ncbi:protein mono-ADP-ribosyltransferase PARP14-like [Mercenaria mercenaria]|uniref:protein mono-ADP-ribosyltransferase PARP14-like n=1 Tax=Mercenaria mercenaria TaxID=6596 RepID=UPI00234F8371|nr:protein mono-ADP-ribosyltransferase PARP14-like [Mercenaria mercenaria]